jgi:uncharacterized DUF497 family protein
MMTFDWNEENSRHIALHHVTPDEAEQAFDNDPIDLEVQEDEDDTFRYKQIGETSSGRILVLLSTDRGSVIRIVTAFDAPKALKDMYFRIKAKQT